MSKEFPRQKAATRNFQLGAPRSFHISEDGGLVTFLRSDHGRDAVNSLWIFDVASNTESKLVDPRTFLADTNDIPEAEKARRERMRETTSGITSYSTDKSGKYLVFTLSGELFAGDLDTKEFRALGVTGAVIDAQVSPDAQHIAWTDGKNLQVCEFDGQNQRALTNEDTDAVAWALADFIGAEEFGRMHGFWWSPNSDGLLVQRTDESAVSTWWISDPSTPSKAPHEQRYPATGTTNATVSLHRIELSGTATRIEWDDDVEYLVDVTWQSGHDALVTVANRSQTQLTTFSVCGDELRLAHSINDSEFCEVIPGQPVWWNDQLLTVEDNRATDTRELRLGGIALTPSGMQIMGVIGTSDDAVDVVSTQDGVSRQLTRITNDGTIVYLTKDSVASATSRAMTSNGSLQVIVESRLDTLSRTYLLMRDGEVIHSFDSHAEQPAVSTRVNFLHTGDNHVNTAVLFPTDHVMGSKKLPVLMRPYGGPHGAQVLKSALIFAEDQWFADQGFVVIVADGQGTPGRGPAWDHAIYQDFVKPVIDDQVAAVTAVAAHFPDDVDATRVGITGWSFGGYLAALAVLERPDVFHASVAGAPVTEWLWYDTAYTERYLGHPEKDPQVYKHNSLMHRADNLQRPLMLVHGLADDNVVAAHSLELSSALLAQGKPHTVLPLSGVTHMTPQEVVAENLMKLTLDFFATHLGN
jgi:dipeptidyl-peptidase-4